MGIHSTRPHDPAKFPAQPAAPEYPCDTCKPGGSAVEKREENALHVFCWQSPAKNKNEIKRHGKREKAAEAAGSDRLHQQDEHEEYKKLLLPVTVKQPLLLVEYKIMALKVNTASCASTGSQDTGYRLTHHSVVLLGKALELWYQW